MQDIPNNFHLQYSKDEIKAQVERLGIGISRWAKEVWAASGRDLVAIPVLRGGIFFFADLVREINCSVEISPAQSWGYVPEKNAVMQEQVRVKFDSDLVVDRHILLIDDICDSGKTLKALAQELASAGSKLVRSAVLVHRQREDQCSKPDWSGFKYHGEEWFVGYGMEDEERFRNLPDIYIIHDEI